MYRTGQLVKLFLFVLLLLLSACTPEKSTRLQGYIEGDYTNLAASVSGILTQIYVNRGSEVNAGDLLYILDLQPEAAQLQQVEQQLAQAVTSVKLSKDNYDRIAKLYQQDAAEQSAYVQAQLTYERDQKRVEQLQASINEAQWRLGQKKIYAPVFGYIFDTYFRVGEFVPAQSPVISMLAPNDIKLIFYIPETLRSQIKIGDIIQFACDGCQQKSSAKINFISPQAEYTPPVIFSRESRKKLMFRVEAQLINNQNRQFYPGIPVDVYIDNN